MHPCPTAGRSFSGNGGGNTWSSRVDGGEGEVSVVATIPFPERKVKMKVLSENTRDVLPFCSSETVASSKVFLVA